MIRFRRFAGVAAAMAAVIGVLALMNAALAAGVGSIAPLLDYGESPTDWSLIEEAGGKIAGAVADLRQTVEPHRPVGLLLGQSTCQWLDVEYLSDQCPEGPRWINLRGVGGTINRSRFLSDIAAESGLPVTDVIVAINPNMLAGTPQAAMEKWFADNNPLHVYKKNIWFAMNRDVAGHLFRLNCYRLRTRVLSAFGLGCEAVFTPGPYAWTNLQHHPPYNYPAQTTRESPEKIQEQIHHNRYHGWFDAKSYRADSSNSESLRYLLAYWLGRGCRVTVVILPDPSEMRNLVPAEGVRLIESIVAEQGGRVPLLNLHAAYPDESFEDLIHMMRSTSKDATVRIAEVLKNRCK